MQRQRLLARGIVQGVGFRPFVYTLARRHGLTGFVGNDTGGVFIEVQGTAEALVAFAHDLRTSPPPLALIESLSIEPLVARPEATFAIVESEAQPAASTPISPDLAICAECRRELFDPRDRRYRYPFINCTNCGPRFTIIRDIPYDRPLTTMRSFAMCPRCAAEYHDPANRRFHAQPNACQHCGPRVCFRRGDHQCSGEEAIRAAIDALAAGEVVAIKGIGGFHLACDAADDAAMRRLRERKGRAEKPFALMVRDLEIARRHAHVSDEEARLLTGHQRPIVLLLARGGTGLSAAVAPGNAYLGMLLPYTPLHYLLLDERPLVMTSGNRSDEPICKDNEAALSRLATLADAFLLHDREIHVVCDDSVIRVFGGHELPIRRSRGYSPLPVALPSALPRVLAVGGELKSTFCLTTGLRAYMSQHIGDMENLETLQAFERAVAHFSTLFRATPERLVCDLHPGYLSTRWAERYAERHALPLVRVQHHHAHIAAVMAEHGLDGARPVIGVSFDGTGYGTDGAIWGGEILVADYARCERPFHLNYVPLPGGDAAVKRPSRMALAHLWAAGIPWGPDLPCVAACSAAELRVLRRMLETGLQCVPTSSMGRLFDAVAALLGVRQVVSYEGQAAIELEAYCASGEVDGAYGFTLEDDSFDPAPLLRQVVQDLRRGVPAPVIAARFHKAVAALVGDACTLVRERRGIEVVAISGGVFQNLRLLEAVQRRLGADGFTILTHRQVPPNDAGLALGQALIGGQAPLPAGKP